MLRFLLMDFYHSVALSVHGVTLLIFKIDLIRAKICGYYLIICGIWISEFNKKGLFHQPFQIQNIFN
jgi:hypothetical protein